MILIPKQESALELAARLTPQEHNVLARARERGQQELALAALREQSKQIDRAQKASHRLSASDMVTLNALAESALEGTGYKVGALRMPRAKKSFVHYTRKFLCAATASGFTATQLADFLDCHKATVWFHLNVATKTKST